MCSFGALYRYQTAMEAKYNGDIEVVQLERDTTLQNSTPTLSEKIQDGDDALKILHAEFEPYTKEEERRVLRKIDLRLCILMLIINGLQFVDKTVLSS
jgi:MFS transporter, ACS family, allantoate permease